MDTRTNRQIAEQKLAENKAKEIMETMIQEDKEIKRELAHFRHQIQRLRNLIESNPVDMTKWIAKEKARLRQELPRVVLRHNVEKAKEIRGAGACQ